VIVVGRGFCFEDLKVGFRFRTHRRTIREADLAAFIALTGLTEELFAVREEKQLVPGALVYSFAEGLLLQTNVLQRPNDLTEARWFAEVVDGGSPYQFSGYLASPVAVTMTSNQWNQLGSTAGTFVGNSGTGSGLFSQNATTGEITYNGPPRSMLVSMRASINNGIGATSIAMHAAIALDGDVVDGGVANYPEFGEQATNIINELRQIVVERVVQLTPGAKLQLMFRNATNGDDIVVTYYQVNLSPL